METQQTPPSGLLADSALKETEESGEPANTGTASSRLGSSAGLGPGVVDQAHEHCPVQLVDVPPGDLGRAHREPRAPSGHPADGN